MRKNSGQAAACDDGFPTQPQMLPRWALEEAMPWCGLDDFSIVVKAEEICKKQLDLKVAELPEKVWGLHLVKDDRARIIINASLSAFWRRFTMFHELYHLLKHKKGEAFWQNTFVPISRFEHEADSFAWAAMQPDCEDIASGFAGFAI